MRAASTAAFFALSTPDAGDRHARRHLHDREQRVEPVEHALRRAERHADHRQVGVRGDDARQRGGEAGAADQHPEPALARGRRVLGDGVRVAVGRAHLELVRDPALGRARRAPPASARGRTRSRRGSRRRGLSRHGWPPDGAMSRAVARARERDRRRALVGERPGLLEIVADAGHVEDPAAVRHQLRRRAAPCRRGRRARRAASAASIPVDRRAGVAALGVLAAGDDDGHRRARRRRRPACRARSPAAAAASAPSRSPLDERQQRPASRGRRSGS